MPGERQGLCALATGDRDRLRARVFVTDGCGAAPRANPQMTPGKTLFDRAVHAQQTLAFIQRQVQALRTLFPTVVLPLFCRVRGAVGKEKGRLKSLSSCALWPQPWFGDAAHQRQRLADRLWPQAPAGA